ncbi:tRNA uridine-5-carboxymethylaminomethyl(34) synthesis enzyme MnmG [Desulfovibrio ferrophilus]|uniref:tRNA uridine 5-carboxymethylaminomethyl modification enzyme MnmG n=1 Tax=Desulfovibrio ferrophilus TaxID=241368 RepID=A0A2Z6AWG4_9BACT|nr:tRNA uridine-5-carboxymethylaminomethyl(34) synthesis enzyme MnmG [Desulfovibrio ferrophilus]BBD07597.1 tRNA uridine 5-carboxymethylaminomethylmodification protein GidA [Desulfovibrio ferrophilus]
MKPIFPDIFDCIVVGAGHAGCEAAMTASSLGMSTLLLTINADRIGHLSCNPAIGGLAKGHMVREIDALGGRMGIWADKAGIQFRRLNTSKGPAVRATRAQIDRDAYLKAVQADIFNQENLWVFQDMAENLLVEQGRVAGVTTQLGQRFGARTVLVTTGTFLQGLIHIGQSNFAGGRLGDPASKGLSASLAALGLELGRLKTGTTPRLLADSIDFSKLDVQHGDVPPPSFSFHAPFNPLPQLPCHITWTNEQTHEAIRSGFDRSPMFTGVIKGVGARYCPSIEDKVARFPDKNRHQIFVEPEGLNSPEVYPNGIPTSLPLDVQKALLATVPGLEKAQIVRPGYAIEYDFCFPTQLDPTLQTKILPGLYLAGQINGTSGYEEAAAQGLWAAANAFCALNGREPFLPGRDQAYMAVLVDDLVTKGTEEPYRMFTSRAEHRLLLREDNADARMTELGRDLGLVTDDHWQIYTTKRDALNTLLAGLKETRIRPDVATCDILANIGASIPGKAVSLGDLLRQPELTIERLEPLYPAIAQAAPEVLREAETIVKYEGYLKRQEQLVARSAHLESERLPEDMDYSKVAGLTREAEEKLDHVRPMTLGQAARISGITPAAISCLEIHLRKLSN